MKLKHKELYIKKLMGALTDKEADQLNRLFSKSSEHQQEFASLKNTWDVTGTYDAPLWTNLDAEWESFQTLRRHHTHQQRRPVKPTKSESKRQFAGSWRLAAAFLTIAVTVFLFKSILPRQVQEPVSVATANAQQMTYTFPDGSTVVLNSGSQVRYLPQFGDGRRHVYLKGEAFFNIQKNKKPFIVETDLASIKVLGTQFNVWSRNEETRVIVKSGLVEVGSRDDAMPSILLKKNFMSRVLADTLPSVSQVDNIAPHLAWLDGKLVFHDKPFGLVIQELERYYDIAIELSDEVLFNRPYTAIFDQLSVENALLKLCKELNLDSKTVTGGTIFLSEKSMKDSNTAQLASDETLREVVREFVKPQLKKHVEPPYPTMARKREEQGTVRMLLRVNKLGQVEQIHVKETSGSIILDNAAQRYAKQLEFEPAKVNDHPVDIWLVWSVNFSLINQQAMRVDVP